MVFGGDGQRIEEDQQDDPPVEQLGLHMHPTLASEETVPLTSLLTAQEGKGEKKSVRR